MAPVSEEEALQPEAPEEEQGEREMEPASFAETEKDRIAATADLPDLQSLEEEQEEKAQLPLEDRSGAGESLSRQQESSPGTDLDAIFAEFSGQSTDTQAEQPAEPPVSEESPALNMLEETAPEPEEVLLEQAAAPLSEEEAGPEESAVESAAEQAFDEADLPNGIETGTEQTAGQAETGSEPASVDLDAIVNAAVNLSEDEELPAEVPVGNSQADSETAIESLPEPAEQLAEEEKPEEEPESTGGVEEALEELEQQPSPQTGEPAPLPEEQSAEKAEELIEEPGSPEPPSEEPVEPAEEQLPAGTIELQEEDIPEGEDERDFVAERVVSLDEKVELEFNLGEKADEAEKILTVDQTIDAIKKKTVECPKCGTKNYAIRWYCENCEATLTSL